MEVSDLPLDPSRFDPTDTACHLIVLPGCRSRDQERKKWGVGIKLVSLCGKFDAKKFTYKLQWQQEHQEC